MDSTAAEEKQGLTTSRPKTRSDIMLPDFRYAGVMMRCQTIESIEWFFFQKQPAVNELKAFKKQKQGDTWQINLISTIANSP